MSRAVAKGGIILVETPVIVQVLSCSARVLARVCSSSSPARTRRWMEALEQTRGRSLRKQLLGGRRRTPRCIVRVQLGNLHRLRVSADA